ncbi:MAG: hypothetical protein JXA66_08690 [Oligoflexia bacterium]|nr:hypothetical protein [Oligoflexia bacterium]
MIKLIIIMIIAPAFFTADNCRDWFNSLNIRQDRDCLTKCLTAPAGMGTFTCTKQCSEFCESNDNVKNPSKQEVINYIAEQCRKKGLPEQVGLAIAWLENRMKQFTNSRPACNENRSKNNKLLSADWGIMQINDKNQERLEI